MGHTIISKQGSYFSGILQVFFACEDQHENIYGHRAIHCKIVGVVFEVYKSMELLIQFVNHGIKPQNVNDDRAQIIHLNEQTHITVLGETQTETLTILLIHQHHLHSQFYYYYLTFVNKFDFLNDPSVRSTLSPYTFKSVCGGSASLPYPSSRVAFLEIAGFASDKLSCC